MDRRERKKTLCVYEDDNEREKEEGEHNTLPFLYTSFYIFFIAVR